jgi:hypothetical protein
MNTLIAFAFFVSPAAAITIAGITKCQAGNTALVGTDTNVFTVQVCNLFGGTCFMNHVELGSGDCAAKALKVENLQCALFPIMSYKNNERTDPAKLQVGGSGCSVSCSGTDCKFSGGCVSVQCSKEGGTFASPGMTKTGSGNARTVGATTYQENHFVGLFVSGSKTVLLSRTGDYVGTYSIGGSASGTNTYNWGKLPTIGGNNYGPKACPSSTTLASAAGATKEELRVCGSTGKWVYFGAANLLMDKSMYVTYSANSATGVASTKINIGSVPFLSGSSKYQSSKHMDDSRALYIHDGTSSSASVLHTSGTISPVKSTHTSMGTQDIAGTWRFYQVVFYCDSYGRTDLTTCPAANQKIFYVADPNPAPAFGITAGAIGSGAAAAGGTAGTAAPGGTIGTAAPGNPSGTTMQTTSGASCEVAGLAALMVVTLMQF